MPKIEPMRHISWYRCPAEITTEEHKKYSDTGLLNGCFVYLGLSQVEFRVGGRVHCVHCGSHMQEVAHKVVGDKPRGVGDVSPDAYILERLEKDLLDPKHKEKPFDPEQWMFGCCMNTECSRHYLGADALESDAIKIKDSSYGATHSATQFVMLRPEEIDPPITSGGKWRLDPREVVRSDWRSWRRCIFCGRLLNITPKPVSRGRVGRGTEEKYDEQGWDYHGPAATFRIYRMEEYRRLLKEPVVIPEE